MINRSLYNSTKNVGFKSDIEYMKFSINTEGLYRYRL